MNNCFIGGTSLTLRTRFTETFSLTGKSASCAVYWINIRADTLFPSRTRKTSGRSNWAVLPYITGCAVCLSIFAEVASRTWHWSIAIRTLMTSFTCAAACLLGLVCVQTLRATLWGRHSLAGTPMTHSTFLTKRCLLLSSHNITTCKSLLCNFVYIVFLCSTFYFSLVIVKIVWLFVSVWLL